MKTAKDSKGTKTSKGKKVKKAEKPAKVAKAAKVEKAEKNKKQKVTKSAQGFKYISPGAVILDEKILIRPEVDRRDPKFKELVASISALGTLIQPLVLNETPKGLRLVCGRQRIDAARIAKVKAVPFITVEGSDEELISMGLDENEARIPMSVVQEAQVLNRAKSILEKSKKGKKVSNVVLGKALNRNERWVGDRLGLLDLPENVLVALDDNTSGDVTIGKCHELFRVHPEDRESVVPVMKKLCAASFRKLLEKMVKAEEIRWAKGKSAPRTEKGKTGKGKGEAKAEKVLHSKTLKEKGAPAVTVDTKTPNQLVKEIKQTEKALLSENKKTEPDIAEVAYQTGYLHALLFGLNLPKSDSLKDSMEKFSAKK